VTTASISHLIWSCSQRQTENTSFAVNAKKPLKNRRSVAIRPHFFANPQRRSKKGIIMSLVDHILDRRDGLVPYDGHAMYEIVQCASKEGAHDVMRAFLEDDERGFQEALARYIRRGMFNRDLILYVYGQRWLVV
jgi:hypothetical protein